MEIRSVARQLQSYNQITLLGAAALLPTGLVGISIITRSAVAESFCAVVAISIGLPPLLAALHRPAMRLIAAGLATLAIALLLLNMPVSFSQWLGVVLIIGSVAIFLAGALAFLPSAIVTVIVLLWLSWPIWLSERLAGHGSIVNVLAVVHPLLAINGQLLDQAIWTERPLMYGWTGLNQDVPFSIPTTVGWCVLLHAGVGGLLLLVQYWNERRRVRLSEIPHRQPSL